MVLDVTEGALRLSNLQGYCEMVPMFLEPWSAADTGQDQHSGMVASIAFGPQVQRASVEIAVWNKGCLLARGRCKNGQILVNMDPAKTMWTVLAGFERIGSSAVALGGLAECLH